MKIWWDFLQAEGKSRPVVMAPRLTELKESLDKALRNVVELLKLLGLASFVPTG